MHLGQRRQACGAHRRRDFQAMIDRKSSGSGIGEELRAHADILFAHWRKVRDGTRRRRRFRRTHAGWLREQVRLLPERGSGCGCAKTEAVGQRLRAAEARLWTFARRDGAEPRNNAAERAVRHAVCWRKTSYGTDRAGGSRFAERMRTVVASCRQQGHGIPEFLTQAVTPGPSRHCCHKEVNGYAVSSRWRVMGGMSENPRRRTGIHSLPPRGSLEPTV